MMLINSIISLADDLDYRMFIRNRFIAVGFTNIRAKLFEMSASNEYLKRQLDKFNDDLSMDWMQYKQMYEELQETQT